MKLFSLIQSQEQKVLKSLLSGHEVQLDEGAFGTLSQQILRLFTEVKRTQSEQTQDLENIPIVSYSYLSFVYIGMHVLTVFSFFQ